jgi:hypothetical protein
LTDKKRTRYEKTADDLANYRISQYPDVAKTLKDRQPDAFAALLRALVTEDARHVARAELSAPRGEARH